MNTSTQFGISCYTTTDNAREYEEENKSMRPGLNTPNYARIRVLQDSLRSLQSKLVTGYTTCNCANRGHFSAWRNPLFAWSDNFIIIIIIIISKAWLNIRVHQSPAGFYIFRNIANGFCLHYVCGEYLTFLFKMVNFSTILSIRLTTLPTVASRLSKHRSSSLVALNEKKREENKFWIANLSCMIHWSSAVWSSLASSVVGSGVGVHWNRTSVCLTQEYILQPFQTVNIWNLFL